MLLIHPLTKVFQKLEQSVWTSQPNGGGGQIFSLSYLTPRYLEGHPERDTRPGLRSLRTAREIQV